jgi:hypothetical protein
MDITGVIHHGDMQVGCPSRRWIVWRQDDHGNRAQVAVFGTKAEADRRTEELEARGHKQLYWVATE